MNSKEKDYEVGYKKPPKEHQFKPGKSGNPKGRSKLVKDFKTDLAEELQEKISINESGKSKVTTKQRAFIKKVIASALNGNACSIRILTQMIASYAKDLEQTVPEELSAEDNEILQLFLERSQNNE